MQRMFRNLTTAFLALGMALSASPALAGATTPADTLRSVCEAADGSFHTGRGYHRCFGAKLDGRNQFTAGEHVCDARLGTDFNWSPTPDSYYGPDRGNWICGIA